MRNEEIAEKMQNLYDSDLMQKAFNFIKSDGEHTLEQHLEIVQIPAFSNYEKERALHFKEMMEAEGYEVHMDKVWNVYTTIPGTGGGPTIYVSAHMDTVFPPETPLEIRRDGNRICVPGIGDDTRGCAEILGLLRAIRQMNLKPVGDIIIGGNVGEEGAGNLRGMRHFFSENADRIDAFVSIDGAMPVLCYGGTGSYRYKVTFRGPGGHSNGAFGLVNSIHAMGRAITYISELRTPHTPKTTFCVGVVEGGTSVNSIASECSMLVDMRSVDQGELDRLDAKFKTCIQKAVEDENDRWSEERDWEQRDISAFDVNARITAELDKFGDRPVGHQPDYFDIVPVVTSAFRISGIEPVFMDFGSTDSNIPLSLGIPSVTIAGGGDSGNGHSVDEWFDPTDAYRGVQKNLLVVFALAGLDGVSEPMVPVRKR